MNEILQNNITIYILIGVIVILMIIIINLMRNYLHINRINDTLISSFNNIKDIITTATNRLLEIDRKGTFSSDDESGFIFTQMKNIQLILQSLFDNTNTNTNND